MILSADLLRGYTEAIILSQLAIGDSYGFEINRSASELSGGLFEMKEATLYTAFRRLEQAGLIRSYWGNQMSGARRRYYAITPAGAAQHQQDIQQWHETRRLLSELLEPSGDLAEIREMRRLRKQEEGQTDE